MAPPTVEEVANEAGPAIKNILTHLACFNCLPSNSEIERLEVSGPLLQYSILSIGLTRFQECMDIPETGVFDIETANHFNKPHCHGTRGRNGRVVESAYKKGHNYENKKTITYCFNEYSCQLSVREIRNIFEKAFNEWEDRLRGPVTFTEVAPHPGKGDIRISWANSGGKGEAGPVFVSYPQSDGVEASTLIEMFFDEDTKWTTQNLYQAVLHYVGHILGSEHSRDKKSVMWPAYANETFSEFDNESISTLRALRETTTTPAVQKFLQSQKVGAQPQSNKEERAWTCILSYRTSGAPNMVAAPKGILYNFDSAGNIWRYENGIGCRQIQFASTDSSSNIRQLVVSSEYLYRLNMDGGIWRHPHHDGCDEWSNIDPEGKGNIKIAASYSSPFVYRYTKDGTVAVFRESTFGGNGYWHSLGSPIPLAPAAISTSPLQVNITAIASDIIYSSSKIILRYEKANNIWTNMGREIPFRKLIGDTDDHSLYRLTPTGEIFVLRLDATSRGVWHKLEVEPSIVNFSSGKYLKDFIASNSHRYILCNGGLGKGDRRGIWYNKRKDRDGEGSFEWVDLKPPSSASQVAAAGDDIYYMDVEKNIFKMSMS
ncbi:hypothetical protein TWF506_001533 [Arthrobotrys conoides]|uniref:Peptidase metallopeptidase domain-containing protein n=1 Tax=Arthrobotrys conoides TaxID=74498 RepID=A0AAN8RY55_9PEZI